MQIFNRKPGPRAIFLGFNDEDLAISGIVKLFPTIKVIDHIYDLSEIRQEEFDVLVTAGTDLTGIKKHLKVVAFETNSFGRFSIQKVGSYDLKVNGISKATEMELADTYPTQMIRDLVSMEMINRVCKSADKNRRTPVLGVIRISAFDASAPTLQDIWRPLIKDAEGNVCYGYIQHAAFPEIWSLPWMDDEEEFVWFYRWLEVLLDYWRGSDPQMFTSSYDWKTDPAWSSPYEKELRDKIEESSTKLLQLQEEYNQKIAKASRELEQAVKEENSGYRGLLTLQNSKLVASVKQCLEFLGLNVVDMDRIYPEGDRREDLQVSNGRDELPILVEVRGYKNGARLNDLMRLNRFSARFARDKGDLPKGLWFVVNSLYEVNPAKREKALSSHPDEVESFATEDNGLVIDTVELFKLRSLVNDGVLSKSEACNLLFESRGYFNALEAKDTVEQKS